MTNHPNRSTARRDFSSSIDVPKGPLGANLPLGRFVVRYEDGSESQGQRAPKEGETAGGKRIVAFAQYGIADGKLIQAHYFN